MKPAPRDPLLLEVMAAIGAGRLFVGPIHDESEQVHGFAITKGKRKGVIHINPSVEVVDTSIHEVLHRIRPKWKEATVRQRTAKLVRLLGPAEVDRIYEIVCVTAKVRKRPVRVECE